MTDEWVYLEHPEINSGPCRFPNDPTVIEVHEGKGWVVTADPDAPEPEQPAEPAKKTSKAAASATTKEE